MRLLNLAWTDVDITSTSNFKGCVICIKSRVPALVIHGRIAIRFNLKHVHKDKYKRVITVTYNN